jgi:hypothetical protein
MNYRAMAAVTAILALAASPFSFLLIFIATPRFMWLWPSSILQILATALICPLLPLPSWRHKVFAGLIPIFVLLLSRSIGVAVLVSSAFVGLTILHPIFIAAARPDWSFSLESGLWGLILTFLCIWVLSGPAIMIHLWLRNLWQPDIKLPLLDVLSLFFVVLLLIVGLLVYLRRLSSLHFDASSKSLNPDAGKAGAA